MQTLWFSSHVLILVDDFMYVINTNRVQFMSVRTDRYIIYAQGQVKTIWFC